MVKEHPFVDFFTDVDQNVVRLLLTAGLPNLKIAYDASGSASSIWDAGAWRQYAEPVGQMAIALGPHELAELSGVFRSERALDGTTWVEFAPTENWIPIRRQAGRARPSTCRALFVSTTV